MLVLQRKKDEQIVIGGNIVVTVIRIMGDKVRLGIDAPDDVVVDRIEVHNSREREARRREGR
jgi:carbon storage regulator